MSTPPVIICGAGPAGLTLALELARFGVRLRIVERLLQPACAADTVVLDARSLELLEACRVTEPVLMFARTAARRRRAPSAYGDVAEVPLETLERTMLVELFAYDVQVERGVTLRAVSQDAAGVSVELASAGGIERARCAYLAACDGADSTVRRRLAPGRRLQMGRVFFLGDAARSTPGWANGLTVAIGDAVNLGWKLALVLNERVDPRLLESYPVERARVRHDRGGLLTSYRRSPLSVHDPFEPGPVRAGARVRGHRPAGYRPQTVVIEPRNSCGAITVVLRPDGYAGYVAAGWHTGGAATYIRNVIGLR